MEAPADVTRQEPEIGLSGDGCYAWVRTNADADIDWTRKVIRSTAAFCREHAIRRLLVDARGHRNRRTIMEEYRLAYEEIVPLLKEFGFSRSWRVALLRDADDDGHGFIETVMRNAGFAIQIHRDEARAVTWLRDGYSSDRP